MTCCDFAISIFLRKPVRFAHLLRTAKVHWTFSCLRSLLGLAPALGLRRSDREALRSGFHTPSDEASVGIPCVSRASFVATYLTSGVVRMKFIALFAVLLMALSSCTDSGGHQRGYIISKSNLEEAEPIAPAQE